MGSGSKGGGQQSKNYYGTIALAFGWGPLDWIRALIANGNYLFKNDDGLDLSADVTDLTGSLIDPSMVMTGGYVKLYRGTETQPADAALRGRHKGTIKLVCRHLFFGQESGVPPNIQMIGGRCPRVSSDIVAAEDNVVDDRQVNPIAAFAEYLIDERGHGFPEALIDEASWLATAHWAWEHREVTFVSALITAATPLRDVARSLLEPINAFCRWTPEGKLGCYHYEWGVNPGGLPLLDANAWTQVPKFTDGAWEDIPTEVVVAYTDRDYQFQDNSVPVPNAAALKVRQVDDSRPLDRKHVMRRSQAARLGLEYIRRVGTAPSTAPISIRAPLFSDLLPGAKVLVDVDPEPGGVGSAQLCRVEKVVQGAGDEATIEVMTDGLLAPVSYQPNWPTTAIPPEAECAPLVHRLAVPLPLSAFAWPPAVAFLATRSAGNQLGFHVLFSSDSGEAYQELGAQNGFAVRASLAANIGSGAGTANLTEIDGLTGHDAYLAADTPGGNQNEAEDDTLLVLFATLDVQSRIALDGASQPIMEFASILERSAVSGATFTYTLLRGRLGTTARAWTSASASVWIVPRANLTEWRHGLLEHLFGATLYFQLQSFTRRAADASVPLPSADINQPTLPPPSGLTATKGTGRTVKLKLVKSPGVDEYRFWRNTANDFNAAVEIAQVKSDSYTDVTGAGLTTYYYWATAETLGEARSLPSAVASVTTGAAVGDLLAPSAPSAPTLVSSDTKIADDGTGTGVFIIGVPALPAGASSLHIRYQTEGKPGMIVADVWDSGRTDSPRRTAIDDLPLGKVIKVDAIAYSVDGEPSTATAATGSPFTAPDPDAPAAPTGLAMSVTANDLAGAQPRYTPAGGKMNCAKATWTKSASKNVAYYEVATDALVTTPSPYDDQLIRTKGTETFAFVFVMYGGGPPSATTKVRAISTVKTATYPDGIPSAWSSDYDSMPSGAYGTKDMATQVSTGVDITGGRTINLTEWSYDSARRFKSNIRTLSGPAALRELGRWRPRVFDWLTKDVKNDIGVIAEETAEVRPDAVYRNAEGQITSVDYTKPVPLLIAAVNHQQRQFQLLLLALVASWIVWLVFG